MKTSICTAAALLAVVMLADSCASRRKLATLRNAGTTAELQLAADRPVPQVNNTQTIRDTLKVQDQEGREVLVMRAVKDDESGEMVATEELSAAIVSARFRNVAERHGQVDIEFMINVNDSMIDPQWQLRFFPRMYVLKDTVDLSPVFITGADYRKSELRGYQLYGRFLESISRDSLRFVDIRQLELFIKRNLPEVYAYKADTSYVSEDKFVSAFGVDSDEALEHYTKYWLVRQNARKLLRLGDVRRRYIRNPGDYPDIRLDTVIRDGTGGVSYRYVQTLRTRPGLRKVDLVLGGEIYDWKSKIYDIPEGKPLTFYISSLSSLVDSREKYRTRIIERRASANSTCWIEFEQGSSEVKLDLGNNSAEVGRISANLRALLSDQVYDLDSILVTSTCSPEGSVSSNAKLAQQRSVSVSRHFAKFIRSVRDSLSAENGFSIDMSGDVVEDSRTEVSFIPRSIPENWTLLDRLIERDTVLRDPEKNAYLDLSSLEPDLRERSMQKLPYYRYLREKIYPYLRTCRFDFYLHRKGMIKDTVWTTELDSTYMRGVQAIRDRDYETAVTLLRPYHDYNTAVAMCSMDYNHSALEILSDLDKTPQVLYMLALLHSRLGDDQTAVQCYMDACAHDPSYVHRGNLDPEISQLVKRYVLNL